VAAARERAEPHLPSWWICVFGGATAGGLLFSRYLPKMLDSTVGPPTGPLFFAACLFAFLNLHHYAIDAVIWRSSGEHVRRIVKAPADVASASARAELVAAP
jgi:hypothetical protein